MYVWSTLSLIWSSSAFVILPLFLLHHQLHMLNPITLWVCKHTLNSLAQTKEISPNSLAWPHIWLHGWIFFMPFITALFLSLELLHVWTTLPPPMLVWALLNNTIVLEVPFIQLRNFSLFIVCWVILSWCVRFFQKPFLYWLEWSYDFFLQSIHMLYFINSHFLLWGAYASLMVHIPHIILLVGRSGRKSPSWLPGGCSLQGILDA